MNDIDQEGTGEVSFEDFVAALVTAPVVQYTRASVVGAFKYFANASARARFAVESSEANRREMFMRRSRRQTMAKSQLLVALTTSRGKLTPESALRLADKTGLFPFGGRDEFDVTKYCEIMMMRSAYSEPDRRNSV